MFRLGRLSCRNTIRLLTFNEIMKKRQLFVIIFLAALAIVGCSRSGDRLAASGTVTLDGKPLESGSINFSPVDSSTNGSGGMVKNGEFEIAADSGLPAGKYSVTILAFSPTGRTVRDPQMGDRPEMAPVRFKEAGTLEAAVTADGSNQFEFKLTSVR